MDRMELEEKLVSLGVKRDAYSLRGGLPNEAYCINQLNEKWEVYYSERGNKVSLKTFESEAEACEYFFNWVTKSFGVIG